MSGKNLLLCNDLEFLKQLKSLKRFDIGKNIDMYKPRDMLIREAMQRAEGSGHTSVEILENKLHRDVLLHALPTVEHLVCDIMLEAYIIDTRPHRHYMPNLKTINKIDIGIKELDKRTKQKKIIETMNNLWRYVGTYRLVKPGVMDEEPCFYITDEVGTSITHSDTPNVRMLPLIYSPNNKVDDAATITYSVMWAIENIGQAQYIQRDFLQGITEEEFRSARLLPWFNVFEEYYAEEY